MKRIFLFVLAIVLLAESASALTTITDISVNSTNITATDYVIGNQGLCISATCINSWASVPSSELNWQGNSTLVAFKDINNVSNSTTFWAGLTAPLASWLSTFNQSYNDFWLANYSAKADYMANITERNLFLSTYNASYMTSYTETDPRWQGNSSSVLNNITNLLSSNTSTNIRIDDLNNSKQDINTNGLENLYDVALTPLSDQDYLVYNGGTSEWINKPVNTYNSTYASIINITPLTCGSTDKFSAVSASGVFTCSADQTGAGGTFNATYDAYITTNISNRSNYWDGLDSPLVTWTDTFNTSYHNFWMANYSAKTDLIGNASERALFTTTYNSSYLTSSYNSSYHGLWNSNRTSTANSSSYWDGLNSPSDITGIGTQAQNLNMGTFNITNTTMVNATQQVIIANTLIINGTGIYKIGGGSWEFI